MQLGALLQALGPAASYYPALARATGGATAAIFYTILLQWQARQGGGGVSCTPAELEAATGLNADEQQLARALLEARSLLQARSQQGQSCTFYPETAPLAERLDAPAADGAAGPPERAPAAPADPHFPVRRPTAGVPVSPDYRFQGPWQSEQQLQAFQRALLEYAKQQGMRNPSAWAFKVIDGLTKGIHSPFWDEFAAGRPLGESQQVQREWEVAPGVPYPAFEEERIQYYRHKGEPLEAAVAKARADLRDPVLGQDLWDGFLRKCDRLADEAITAREAGVSHPALPSSFTERRQVTKESVMEKLARAGSPAASLTAETSSEGGGEDTAQASQRGTDGGSDTPADEAEVPSLEALRRAYRTPMGREYVERQIAAHPEWGYAIEGGEVVDRYPF
ncbi:MAG: hypothetical protein BRC58_04735 [Cyanobacteria bacterium QS_8_64_29]|nr:MAG: hypothetical protein BRC58_04735 [Cyanobacteria bacterium QS_8_64_29]